MGPGKGQVQDCVSEVPSNGPWGKGGGGSEGRAQVRSDWGPVGDEHRETREGGTIRGKRVRATTAGSESMEVESLTLRDLWWG